MRLRLRVPGTRVASLSTARLRALPMVAVLTACAGTPAVASPQGPAAQEAGDPGRLHIYQVAPEQAVQGQVAPERGVIEVSGRASVQVPADRARISFAVETRGEAAAGAAASNAEAMEAVFGALRRSDVSGLEIETFGYALRPEYRTRNDRSREIDGYVALNNIRVTVPDLSAVGRVIDAATSAGANRVASLRFEATDTDQARTNALEMAVHQATAEARTIARALGHELGEPLEVRGGAQLPQPRFMEEAGARFEAAGQAVTTPVEAGDQAVTASVSIKFALGAVRSGR